MKSRASLAILAIAVCNVTADPALRQLDQCPDGVLYGPKPTPTGWPLTPTDWSFGAEQCWASKHLICGGERQSPMDIDLSAAAAYCDTARTGANGTFTQRAHYAEAAGPVTFELCEYHGTLMAAGDFGHLNVTEEGKNTTYDAVQLHFAAPSLHTVNGTAYDAELIVFHQRRGGRGSLLGHSIALSVFFSSAPGPWTTFDSLGLSSDKSSWSTPSTLNVAAFIAPALKGASYTYDGSMPVPPCHENVKWIILGTPQSATADQIKLLKERVLESRGRRGYRKPLPRNRCVFVNSPNIGGDHGAPTCEAAYDKGTWLKSSECWNVNDRCYGKRFSAVDINTSNAIEPTERHPEMKMSDWVRYKTVDNIEVAASSYTLDAFVEKHANFGNLILNGHIFYAMNVSFKAISQHTLDGVYSQGELLIEHVMFGDTFGEGLPHFVNHMHKVIVSIPLKLGPENVLLRKLGLDEGTSRSINDGMSFFSTTPINLADDLKDALAGRWFWYSSNTSHPDCGTSVRWMIFEKQLSISMAQLNLLRVPVSGVDSSHLDRPIATRIWRQNLPPDAVEADETACSNLPQVDFHYGESHPHWDYANARCWNEHYPICGAGHAQSPIDVPTDVGLSVVEDNFLEKCSWKPVENLRVTNTGHNIQVNNEQFGYVTFINEAGFPDYYQVVQFHIHMPSEHLIGGKQFAAELHIVHKRQNTVLDLAPDDMLVTAIMFDIGDEDSHSPVLRQLFLPDGTDELTEEGSYKTMPRPFDPMRAFGPVIDGTFYRYDGGLTTPPCSEVVKWFVFETPMTMSSKQWLSFKELYPNPQNNRPVQPLNGRKVARNSFEQGNAKDYDFFLGRDIGRNRSSANAALILFPIIGTVLLCVVVMVSVFVREEKRLRRQSAGGLAETIGKGQYKSFISET